MDILNKQHDEALNSSALDMGEWHSGETMHDIEYLIDTLAGEDKNLETKSPCHCRCFDMIQKGA